MKVWSFLCLLLAGCFQDSTPQHSEFLPLDYRTKFQRVRPCRPNAAHDSNYQQVFANPIAAQPFFPSSYPLPPGSVVVAEQHQDPGCNSLLGFFLMTKENPGYDTANNDWHWQGLDSVERVSKDGRLTECVSCHSKSPCSDYLCAPP